MGPKRIKGETVQFARLNDTVIHYQLIGAPAGKPVIVFANSLGTDFRIWRDVIVRLAGDYAIVPTTSAATACPSSATRPIQSRTMPPISPACSIISR